MTLKFPIGKDKENISLQTSRKYTLPYTKN